MQVTLWQIATQPNETWAMDFVHDQLATGRKLSVLTIVDTFSRFSPETFGGKINKAWLISRQEFRDNACVCNVGTRDKSNMEGNVI